MMNSANDQGDPSVVGMTLAHRVGFLLELPESEFKRLHRIQQEHGEQELRRRLRDTVRRRRGQTEGREA